MKRIKKGLLSLTLGLVLSLGVGASIGVNKAATPVKAAEEKTVSWTPQKTGVVGQSGVKELDLGGLISKKAETSTGEIYTGDYKWSYTRTLVALDSGASDYVCNNLGNTNGYLQLGSSKSQESLKFETSELNNFKITKIEIDCASGKNNSKVATHKLTVSVNNTKYTLNPSSMPVWNYNNGGGDIVTATGSSKGDIVIFIGDTTTNAALYIKSISVTFEDDGASVKEAEAWGKSFMEGTTTATCEDINADNSEDLIYSWSLFEAQYNKISDGAKEIVKKATANNNGSTYLEKAVARYDHIITRYGSKLGVNANFIGREIKSTSGTHNILASADNGLTIAIIVIVSLVSVSSIIGTTIIIRKRKTN